MRPKRLCAFRSSASSSRLSSASSGTGAKRATRYGSSVTGSSSWMRRRPWTRIRSVPSGTRIILCTTAAVPIEYRSSQPGVSTSASRTVTSASSRSPPTTSSTSAIERSCPIASGVIDSGKTTVSLSGSTGSSDGISSTCAGGVSVNSISLIA